MAARCEAEEGAQQEQQQQTVLSSSSEVPHPLHVEEVRHDFGRACHQLAADGLPPQASAIAFLPAGWAQLGPKIDYETAARVGDHWHLMFKQNELDAGIKGRMARLEEAQRVLQEQIDRLNKERDAEREMRKADNQVHAEFRERVTQALIEAGDKLLKIADALQVPDRTPRDETSSQPSNSADPHNITDHRSLPMDLENNSEKPL